MKKTNPLSKIENDIKNLASNIPTDNEDIVEWVNKLDMSFSQTVEAIENIIDNNTLENDINEINKSI